jgi:magnesium chelatase family protein
MSSVISNNAGMRPADVRVHCKLDDTDQAPIRSAMSQPQLSARAFHRVLKLSRTIADLAEAIQYRPRRIPNPFPHANSLLSTSGGAYRIRCG